MSVNDPIAIVGMSGLFPGALDLTTLWGNIRTGVDATAEVRPQRWFADPARMTSARFEPDKAYSARCCLLPDFDFDPRRDLVPRPDAGPARARPALPGGAHRRARGAHGPRRPGPRPHAHRGHPGRHRAADRLLLGPDARDPRAGRRSRSMRRIEARSPLHPKKPHALSGRPGRGSAGRAPVEGPRSRRRQLYARCRLRLLPLRRQAGLRRARRRAERTPCWPAGVSRPDCLLHPGRFQPAAGAFPSRPLRAVRRTCRRPGGGRRRRLLVLKRLADALRDRTTSTR